MNRLKRFVLNNFVLKGMIKKFLLFLIRLYQKTFSLDHGFAGKLFPTLRYCRFVPTCSEYSYDAINRYGVVKGLYLAIKRLLRCNPWNKSDRYDPVP